VSRISLRLQPTLPCFLLTTRASQAGVEIFKHPRVGKPARRTLFLAPDGQSIGFAKGSSSKKKKSSLKRVKKLIPINTVFEVREGLDTDNFQRTTGEYLSAFNDQDKGNVALNHFTSWCFSLMTQSR
jgi:hypothetical protein